MRPVVVAGAGKLAALLLDAMDGDERWRPIACLDEEKAGSSLLGVPVVHPRDYDPRDCRQALMAIGEAAMRRRFLERLAGLDLDWLTYQDRRSHVSRHSEIGEGVLVFPFASVGPLSSVGRFSYLSAYACVGGATVVGEHTSLLPRALAGSTCRIGSDCSLGLNSTCLDGAVVGDRVTVAPHTLVRQDVPPGALIAGNPARTMTARP